MPTRFGLSTYYSLISFVTAIIFGAGLAIALTIWWLHAIAIREAADSAGTLATVLAEQTNGAVQAIDLVLGDLEKEIRRRSDTAKTPDQLLQSPEVNKLLQERLSHLSQAERILLVNSEGLGLNTTVEFPATPINLSDRSYFRHFKARNDPGMFVSNVTDRRTGKPLLIFARHLTNSADDFIGVVLIAIDFKYFASIYNSISSIAGRTFVLLHQDGSVIVRYADGKTYTGEKLPPTSPWYDLVRHGGGQFEGGSIFDNEKRLVAVRPLKNYPFAVNVAVSERSALSTWRTEAMSIGAGTLLVVGCSAFMLFLLRGQFRKLTTSERDLVRKSQELERSNATVDAALDNMSQGLATFDSSARLVICNRRYLDMYNLSGDIVRPGLSLHDVLRQRIIAGTFSNMQVDPYTEVDSYTSVVLAAVRRGMADSKIVHLEDGRVMRVINQPTVDGGWVATHEDITAQKRFEERIEYAAHHDSLTGLPNRKYFYERLEQLTITVRGEEHFAVLYLDLDHLKQINDTLGHGVGDELLKGVAGRIRACVELTDTVARLGGDEFAIVQSRISDTSDVAALAEKVQEAVRQPYQIHHSTIMTDISIGIAIANPDLCNTSDLLKAADIALYEAKNTKRGSYCFYRPEMSDRIQTRATLEIELRAALSKAEFELFYQPIVAVKDGRVTSFEALVRWNHPTKGLVFPGEFIPLAEETGLIVPLGEWILNEACAEAAAWPEEIGISVNVSPMQIANSSLSNTVVHALASAGLNGGRLTLEVTESAFLRNTPGNLSTLNRVRELGVQFAMDDFGTGYSSLGYLLSFPFSKIKIDRSFIAALSDKKESRAVVRAIVDLARGLKMQVVAEGVETVAELRQLHRLSCGEMQGYLIGRPGPAAAARALVCPDQTPPLLSADESIAMTGTKGPAKTQSKRRERSERWRGRAVRKHAG